MSGSSMDWAFDTLGVKHSFAVEMRPSFRDQRVFGYVLPEDQIRIACKEVFAGVEAVLNQLKTYSADASKKQNNTSKRCLDRFLVILWLHFTLFIFSAYLWHLSDIFNL